MSIDVGANTPQSCAYQLSNVTKNERATRAKNYSNVFTRPLVCHSRVKDGEASHDVHDQDTMR